MKDHKKTALMLRWEPCENDHFIPLVILLTPPNMMRAGPYSVWDGSVSILVPWSLESRPEGKSHQDRGDQWGKRIHVPVKEHVELIQNQLNLAECPYCHTRGNPEDYTNNSDRHNEPSETSQKRLDPSWHDIYLFFFCFGFGRREEVMNFSPQSIIAIPIRYVMITPASCGSAEESHHRNTREPVTIALVRVPKHRRQSVPPNLRKRFISIGEGMWTCCFPIVNNTTIYTD